VDIIEQRTPMDVGEYDSDYMHGRGEGIFDTEHGEQ